MERNITAAECMEGYTAQEQLSKVVVGELKVNLAKD